MSDSYAARDQSAEGTIASPPLLNQTVGNPKIRNTNVGTNGDTGHASTDLVTGDSGAPSWASSCDRPNE